MQYPGQESYLRVMIVFPRNGSCLCSENDRLFLTRRSSQSHWAACLCDVIDRVWHARSTESQKRLSTCALGHYPRLLYTCPRLFEGSRSRALHVDRAQTSTSPPCPSIAGMPIHTAVKKGECILATYIPILVCIIFSAAAGGGGVIFVSPDFSQAVIN